MYVHDEFGKLLERERISSNEHLTRAILRERAATEEERLKAQRFVSAETPRGDSGFSSMCVFRLVSSCWWKREADLFLLFGFSLLLLNSTSFYFFFYQIALSLRLAD